MPTRPGLQRGFSLGSKAETGFTVALFLKGDSAAAIEQFEPALQINPAFEEAKLNLGAAEKKKTLSALRW